LVVGLQFSYARHSSSLRSGYTRLAALSSGAPPFTAVPGGPTNHGSFTAAHEAMPRRTIALDPTSGPSGTAPKVTLSGFPPNGLATVNVTNASVPTFSIWSEVLNISPSGGASELFAPKVVANSGSFAFTAIESGAPNVTAEYNVTTNFSTSLHASPNPGSAGKKVDVTGGGFAPSQLVQVYFGSQSLSYLNLTDTEANSGGNAATTITMPNEPAAAYVLFADDGKGDYAATTLNISPTLSLSPTEGAPGTPVKAVGTGFPQLAS
jgi:hypothetical protein